MTSAMQTSDAETPDAGTRYESTAARFYAARDIRLVHETGLVIPAGHSLVHVRAVGLCGSDLHWFEEGGIGESRIEAPLVGGHEMSGVAETGPLAGRAVAIDPSIPCLSCDMCRHGYYNLCRNVVFAGHSNRDGGLQEYLAWPTELLEPLPDGMTHAEGAMLEPLGVAIHAFDLGHVHLGDTVAVLGAGPIGLCLVAVAAAAGGAARILASDPLPHRRVAAEACGAAAAYDPAARDYLTELEAATGGVGVDVVFECAGTDAAIDAAVRAARPGARVVLAGIPSTDKSAFPASIARRKGLTLVMARRMNDVYRRAITLVGSGKVDVASLVSHRFPLSDVQTAFDVAVRREGLKVIVEPSD
jgi:L-iditol 2-dehydrogenase